MKYFVAIEPKDENNSDYGALIPDFPGCTAQANTLVKTIADIAEAAEEWIKAAYKNGIDIPEPSDLESLREQNDDLLNWIWCLVDVDTSKYVDKAERINITLPTKVLRRLDRYAELAGETRSGYIANLVLSR